MTSYIDWAAPTFLVTLVGLPAVSVPCGLSAAGLPIGAQLIGPRFSEPRLLAAARFVESVAAIGSPASRRAAPA
jgi:amidase